MLIDLKLNETVFIRLNKNTDRYILKDFVVERKEIEFLGDKAIVTLTLIRDDGSYKSLKSGHWR